MIIQRTLENIGIHLRRHSLLQASLSSKLVRHFCSDDDFKPKSKITITDESARNLIDKWVLENDILLFMKGTPQAPQCGYSSFVVELLKLYGIKKYFSVNVLNDRILKEQIKLYSSWPTFPQFYLKGELIGGCDILAELHQEGQLAKIFEQKGIQFSFSNNK